VAAALLGGVTYAGGRRIYLAASRYRRKEGKLADAMRRSYEHGDESNRFTSANHKSGRHEANISRIQGLTTWAAHAVFAAMVVASLILGFDGVARGTLEPSAVAVFVMYALMLRGPVVQLARQGSRTGKIAASAHRLAELVASTSDTATDGPVPTIGNVRLTDVRVRARFRGDVRRRLLGPIDLSIAPGQRLAVVGPPACGKSTLLRVIAGVQRVHRGTIEWDGLESGPVHTGAVAFAGDTPQWPARPLGELLELSAEECKALVEASGLFSLGRRDWSAADAIVKPDSLSATERRIMGTNLACLSPASLVVLDDPAQGLGPNRSARFIRAICEMRPSRTVMIALRRVTDDDPFDDVIKLRRGRVVGALDERETLTESAICRERKQ
jgi:ATP-binding cassette, subfamily C, bacterial LapB